MPSTPALINSPAAAKRTGAMADRLNIQNPAQVKPKASASDKRVSARS